MPNYVYRSPILKEIHSMLWKDGSITPGRMKRLASELEKADAALDREHKKAGAAQSAQPVPPRE